MQLIAILLVNISVLTMLSGIAVFFGSSKADKPQGAWFLLAAFCEVLWAVPIALFLTLPTSAGESAPVCIKMLYVSAMIMDAAVLGYIAWRYRVGKILTLVFLFGGILLSCFFLLDTGILYSEIILSNAGNRIVIDRNGWFYWAYIIYFCTLVPTFLAALIYRIRHTKTKNIKNGLVVFLIGTGLAGFLSLVFDLLLPLERYDLIWIGPMAIGLMILSFYYAILRFRVLHLSTSWLKVLSFVILALTCAVVYMIIFFVVFAALFRIPNPSPEVLLLNFVMIAIIIALTPAVREVSMFLKSMISVNQLNFEYIVRKICKIDEKNLNLKELAGFLADNMHYSYVLFLINGRVYGSSSVKLGADEIMKTEKIKMPKSGIWQEINEDNKKILDKYDVSKIGILVGKNGEPFGQIIFGKKLNKVEIERKDLIKFETIVNLSAMVIENGGRKS